MADLLATLDKIAAQLGIEGAQLGVYAMEDTIGGYHVDKSKQKWMMGSIWSDEGQIIYALIRALKPETVVQIGGYVGCSATHIAAALKANGGGKLISIDNNSQIGEHGAQVPDQYRHLIEFVKANGEDWLAEQEANSLDFVFEDANHSTDLVALLSELSLKALRPGGLLVTHDAAHDFALYGNGQMVPDGMGLQVRTGLTRAGADFTVYLTDDSDCGLSVAQKPPIVEPKELPVVNKRGRKPKK